MAQCKIGLQLYTVRDELERDFIGTLGKVAELGYQGVEFAGYGGLSAKVLSDQLTQLNLQAIGSHVSLERLSNHLEEEIQYLREIGGQYLILPYLDEDCRSNETVWQRTIDQIHEIAQACHDYGVSFCYHNHEFELTALINGVPALDRMFTQIPQEQLKVELDACWVHAAGMDPFDYLEKYQGRTPLVHFKDYVRNASGEVQTMVLGQGMMPLQEIAVKAEVVGAEWLIVEQDSCIQPTLASIAASMEWVKQQLNN